ncbi:MAG: prolipoprotein diacylglyceryl transferase [Caulobacteraceae bacterium]|nr:prolipoprotein diacylglyceryl transferase [Caulobacteraceae bacterium]
MRVILAAIQFPNIDPAALTIPGFDLFGGHWGPFPLRWYALAYIVGLVLGWRWMVWLIRRDKLWAPNKPALSVPQADDFLFWATLGVILGGRIGYVLFYKPDMIWRNFMEVFQIWQGGMSFHGGLIGVAVAAWWFTRQTHVNEEQYAKLAAKHAVDKAPNGEGAKYTRFGEDKWILKTEAEAARVKAKTDKVDLLRLGDIAAAAAPLGLFFGRIANFINGELWGRPTDAPWGMIFCNDRLLMQGGGACAAGMEPRHPSQLYEAALEGVALFTIINFLTLRYDTLRRPGMNTGVFLVCYGLFRGLLETVREPDAHMPEALRGFITMGMLLSLPMIAFGVWLIRRALKQPKLASA